MADNSDDESIDELFKRKGGEFLDAIDDLIENNIPFLDPFNRKKARDTIDEGREALRFPRRDPLTTARENLQQVSEFVRQKAGFQINVDRIFGQFRKPTLQEELDRIERRRH
ncbi:MAG TPA: hypothetical protein PKD92_00875 [Novosphingobium sp.]|nr:hypothetical protein [Novosphingobium sp.]HMP55111.1 hypothetical protein [Novosphingobium sp.]